MTGFVCTDCGMFLEHSCHNETEPRFKSPAAASIAAIADSLSKLAGGVNQKETVERLTKEFLDKLDTTAPTNMHVLIVDDEKFIRDTLTRMLGNCGYTGLFTTIVTIISCEIRYDFFLNLRFETLAIALNPSGLFDLIVFSDGV